MTLAVAAVAGVAMARAGGGGEKSRPPARRPPATFAAVPAACGTVRADQIGRYVSSPVAAPLAANSANDYFSQGTSLGDGRSCEWKARGTPRREEFHATARIGVARGVSVEDAVSVAINDFVKLEDEARKPSLSDERAPRPEPISNGVGDEAYKIGVTVGKGRVQRATVVSRTANLLVEVRYEATIRKALDGDDVYDGWQHLYDGAVQISRWIIASLQAARSRPPSGS